MSEQLNSLFSISISKDSLCVYLEILKPLNKYPRKTILDSIMENLKQLKVGYGIDQNIIKDTIQHHLSTGIIPQDILIAKGTSCTHKQTEGVKWFIDPDLAYDYQRVVAPGQFLGHTISEPQGIPGKDVYGLQIKPQDKDDQQVTAGKGTYTKKENNSESGKEQTSYYAQFLGVMSLIENRLIVDPIVKISDSKLTAQIELYGFLGDDKRSKVNIIHILDTLERMNIHYGWNGKLIQTALFNSHRIKPASLKDKSPERLTIVTGKGPVAAKFGELEWKLNYKSEKIEERVALPGQTIASYQCLEQAVPGVDVFGEIIPVDQVQENIIQNGEGISLMIKDNTVYRYVASYFGILNISDKVNLQPLVTVSEDKLTAYIELPVYTEDKKQISYAAVEKSMQAMGIVYGINEEEIKKQLKGLNAGEIKTTEEKPFHKIVIAQGKPPVEGVDAYLELNHSLTAGKLLENGSIDFKERSYPWNVKKGGEIGRKVPLVPAVRGIDVFNEHISASPAKDLKLAVVGIHHTPDGKLFASIDGVLIVNNTNLAVTETLVLSGDVSSKTGNIHTDSTVMIKGAVDPGFTVETKADLIIDVNVEKATAKAEGNVIIHGGVRGNRSQIEANGEVNAHFMEHADVNSNTNIIIADNALDCNFIATDSIIAGDDTNRNCSVIGGNLHAFNKISVGELGSISNIKTFISAGYSQADLDEQADLIKEIETSQKRFDHIESYYATSQVSGMNDEIMMMMAELEPLGKKIESLKEEQSDLDKKIESGKESVIEIHKIAYPGVKITICDQSLILNREYKRGKFSLENNELVFNKL